MPMLERTAASLESCHFQRVLPPTKTPFKSRRRLHTAFWQHGAADIELSQVWQALIRDPLESFNLSPTCYSSPSSRSESQDASSFLLDFLYPQGAASLLRKLSPLVLDRYERPRLYLRGTVPRLFSSSASSSQQSRASADEPAANAVTENASARDGFNSLAGNIHERVVNDFANLADGASVPVAGSKEHVREYGCGKGDAPTSNALAPEVACQEDIDTMSAKLEYGLQDQLASSKRESLRDLLDLNDDGYRFERIWYRFHAFAGAEEFRSQFMDYVTKHQSLTFLLAKSLQEGHWRTLWHVWTRYPEAHREDMEAIDWEEFQRRFKVEKMKQGLTSLIEEMHHFKDGALTGADLKFDKTMLSRFIYPVIHRYYQKLSSTDHMRLPKLLNDPLLYELFLGHTTSSPELRELSDRLYRAYRKVPGLKIRGHVMRAMVHQVYKPWSHAEGMEMVLQDLYGRFPRLDLGLYNAFISFYAQRGDVNHTQRLFDEYRTHYTEKRTAKQPSPTRYPDFFNLLQLYAIRGELGEARRIFSQAQADFGPELNVRCWNVLLNAHAKAREYEAAVRVFGVLKQTVTADQYSYGTLMGMSGSRGDLEFTLELYRMAKSEDIQPNITMVDCVVEAYCQNDRFNDAENIVRITTERKRFEKNELTILWNSLLWHHAFRRDLTTLNRILNKMMEFDVPYDDATYSHLLRALAWCKQPHHALFLLQQAVKNHTFKPTLEHYALLMSAFYKTGQPREMLRTSTILRSLGMPQTGDLLLRVLQALSAWSTQLRQSDPDQSRNYLISALRQFRKSIERSKNSTENLPSRTPKDKEPWVKPNVRPTTSVMRIEHTNVLIHTFTLMRRGTDVKDIIELWKSSSPEATNTEEPPLRLLHSLMHSAFYEGNHDEVRRIWHVIFDRAVQTSHVSAPGTQREQALPALRYMLTDPLKTMQRLHGVTKDPDGLRETVTSVLRAGFRLDSKNWNFYVQLLADLKRWREAFIVCEDQLMPYWRGWARLRAKTNNVPTRISLDVRRMSMNTQYPRPTSFTLMVLSKAYMDLEQMASWSGEAERLLAYIVSKCPATVSAVTSAIRSNTSLEQRILSRGKPKDSRDNTDQELREEHQERRSRDEAKRTSRKEAEIPQSFVEMMEQAVSEESSMSHSQDWGLDDEAPFEGETEATSIAGASGTGVEQEEGWYDTNEQDDDSWTPMSSEQGLAAHNELQDAEAIIFGGQSRPESFAEAETEAEESASFAAHNAFLERPLWRLTDSKSAAKAGRGKRGVAPYDADEARVNNPTGVDSTDGKDKERSKD